MVIAYQTVCSLLSKAYKLQSKQEFINDNKEDLKSSFDTAKNLEDYSYLNVLDNLNDNLHLNYTIVYSPTRANIPLIIEKDKNVTLHEFAKLFCDVEHTIDRTLFYQAIEKDGIEQDLEPMSLLLQFDMYVEKIQTARKLSTKKIHRNDPCPCGSGKHYKKCHGIPS